MENKTTKSANYNRGERFFNISNFPQMFQASYGFATGTALSNQADRSKMFQPDTVTLTRTSTGTHTLKHNLGKQRLILNITPILTGTQARYSFTDNNNIKIETFSAAGALVDTPYSFILYDVI